MLAMLDWKTPKGMLAFLSIVGYGLALKSLVMHGNPCYFALKGSIFYAGYLVLAGLEGMKRDAD